MSARVVTLFRVLLIIRLQISGLLLSDPQAVCKHICATALITSNEGGTDLFCDHDCSIQQCNTGCSLYPNAVNSSCQTVCASAYQEKVKVPEIHSPSLDEIRNCDRGCSTGLDIYSRNIRRKLGWVETPPTLFTLSYSSLTLKWETQILENVIYKVHKRLVDTDAGWHLHADATFWQDGKIELASLHPYVTYQFKVLIVVSSLPNYLVETNETVEITTEANGAPSTAPQITSMTAPFPQVISVTWTSPPLTNGKIRSYRIYVQDVNHSQINMTTINVPSHATSWILNQLQSSQTYAISISAWNSVGEGPRISSTITTPSSGELSAQDTPYLILGTANKIVRRTITDVIHYGPELSPTIHAHPDKAALMKGEVLHILEGGNVAGISLHVRRQLILATDSSGSVTLISLKDNTHKRNYYPSISGARAISVDWLADRVYITSTDRIYSCPLDKDMCVSVVLGLAGTANDINVDPINGYLYYVLTGKGQGLYRIALGVIAHYWTSPVQEPSLPSSTPQHIVAMNDLLAHIIDFHNLQLYVVNSTAKMMISSFLDGSRMLPFHEKMVKSAFTKVSSMIMYNQTFIWTDKKKMYIEKYESDLQIYRHNELQFLTPPYAGLDMYHVSAQPVPVPVNAPDGIEALFTRDIADIKWMPPPMLHYQGPGAWMNWTYELQLSKSNESGDLLNEPWEYSISGLNLTVTNLEPDHVYSIKIRARSTSGCGPWSRGIIGRTLKYDGLTVLLGLAESQIVEYDIDHGTEKTLVNFSSNAIDIDWHGDIVLWVTESGSLFAYNRITQQEEELQTIAHANCIAYDWVGHKVYWFAQDLEMILRSDMNGISHEDICSTKARDLAIDEINGRLYWATQYSIETSYLNGDDHRDIFRLPLYSARQIISLTLDLDSGKVLWYERNYNFRSVFWADIMFLQNMGHLPRSPIKGGEFKSIASESAIQHFSHHLFWLSEHKSLVVGDSHGNYSSRVNFSSSLTCFAVTHPSMHSFRSNTPVDQVNVMPNPVQSEDIHIEGVWSDFNVTWPMSTEVTHGIVFYKVFVELGWSSKHLTTSNNFCEISGLSPYAKLVVSIQPYTFWGYANPTTVPLRSPMSKPTAPLSPEVYVIEHKNATASHQSLAGDFRWMTPQITNGIISHHLVTYWAGNGSQTVVKVKGTARHFILTPLVKAKTYHFMVHFIDCTDVFHHIDCANVFHHKMARGISAELKVVACNEAGCGPESDTKIATTSAIIPVPTLLMASKQGLSLTEIGSQLNSAVVLSDTFPKAVNFLAQDDHRMFWINIKNKVYESINSSIQEVIALNGTGQDLTIDWVSRTLYIVESVSPGESSIMQFNIDMRNYRMFLSRPTYIGSILADPYNSVLIWTEITFEGQGQIMKADITTGVAEVVLGSKDSRSRRSSDKALCSCPQTLNVAPVIAMNYKDHDGATEIVFADKVTSVIYSSDISGCQCTRIIGPTISKGLGLPPSLLAVDHMRVSWYNKTEGKLYSINKTSGAGLVVHDISDVENILAYGSHLQPLPDSQCLDAGAYNTSVKIVHIGITSVNLEVTAPVRPTACQSISSPLYKYTIYYRKVKVLKMEVEPDDCRIDLSLCDKQHFYTTSVELKNLDPYSQYMMQVAVSNHYTEYLSEVLGDPLFLTTMIGVPEAARNVSANRLTPVTMSVAWWPPLKLNVPPEDISYVVQYSTVTTKGRIQKEIEKVAGYEIPEGLVAIDLTNLEADHTYSIRVLTCTFNKTSCSVTDSVQCHTFKNPSEITFGNATAHSFEIKWKPPPGHEISRHQTIYAEVGPGRLNWTELNLLAETGNTSEYIETATALLPNTVYAVRLRLVYDARPFHKAFYLWPPDETRFTHRTLVFHPDQPLPPTVTRLKSGVYEVRWEEPVNNGAPVINYVLEYSRVDEGIWITVYNDSLEYWPIETSRVKHGIEYVFRVAAVNSQGIGSFSENSTVYLTSLAMEAHHSNHATIGVVVGIIALLAIIIGAIVCVLQKRCVKSKCIIPPQYIIRGSDTELATLRELPHTTFQQSNTLYAINIQCTEEEISKLPHFSRNQLVLTIFLGSGAFGEVFEGLAKNIMGNSTGETKCAVKTLHKGASDREKEEFLKEALLMKNFQHEHILSLLGVCLDNDPEFIIMELMEGGDLLSFLRTCRATSTSRRLCYAWLHLLDAHYYGDHTDPILISQAAMKKACIQGMLHEREIVALVTPAKLRLPDLVKICLHVARGCKYLEDMHFVHRDLAARNCLVSTKSPANMTVKIGDFGLARDIYKNDYYRKEGEGLLPVRWMSPESLVDGFFTTQSDIWAFGVLMWEVVTLGQQPYPARTNIEVLHFVRDRGKLERPDKCADELYSFMSKCWNFQPDNRPCFASLVEHLEIFQDKCNRMTASEIAQYSPSFADASIEVLEPLNEEDEEEETEEEAVTRGLFAPNSRTMTGGGSVRLTQSGKQRRLNDLLGSHDTPEKLMVDLTKTRRKRTHSLEDSKHSLQSKPSSVITNDHFPAAGEYDHNGYLEPRGTKGGGRYLELMNYAPELLHLHDPHGNPLSSENGSAFMPVHVTHKGYHPSNIGYTLLSPEEDTDDSVCHRSTGNSSGSDVCGVEDPRVDTQSPSRQLYGFASKEGSPMSSPGQGCLPPHSSRTKQKQFEDYHHQSSLSRSPGMMIKLSPQRKYSDQDLYSSTTAYRQHCPSSSSPSQEHRYTSVECNNNRGSTSNGNFGGDQAEARDSSSNEFIRNRHGSGGNFHTNNTKAGLGNLHSMNLPATGEEESSKRSSTRGTWASNLDNVFIDNGTASECSTQHGGDIINYPVHGFRSSGSRNQVHPENGAALVGYDINQVSLV